MYAIGSFEPLSNSNSGRRCSRSPLLLGSQYRKDRCRVGRGHRRREQQREREREPVAQIRGEQEDESADDERRKQHSGSRKHYSRGEYGSYLGELGVHTARKEDDTQRQHSDELRQFGRIEQYQFVSEEQTHAEEQQQGGRTQTVRHLARQYRDKEKNRYDEQKIFACNYHIYFNVLL